VFFQFVFSATAATIVSGALAERTDFRAYVIYSCAISGFVYPVVTHWVWDGAGWLAQMGMVDYAGSTVVHSVGGAAALMGAVIVGPRIGRFNPDGSVNDIPGHSTLLACLGAMILWMGFFAFNGGSELAILGSSNVVGKVFLSLLSLLSLLLFLPTPSQLRLPLPPLNLLLPPPYSLLTLF